VIVVGLRHIAVGYDGSAASEDASRWAVREAAARGPSDPRPRGPGDPCPPTISDNFRGGWTFAPAVGVPGLAR
jgi:hypothetical protein